jgi:hypothetical protein
MDDMSQESSVKASRAIGAMFFSIFGAVWLIVGSLLAYGIRPDILSLIIAVTIIIFLASLRQFRENRGAHAAEANSPANKKTSRNFNIVNAAQWILIIIAANVLSNLGHQAWIIPSIIFIVGLHFLPLGWVFKYSRHYITGAAMILLAVIISLVSTTGPLNSIGCLGAGIILWMSAIGALMSKPSSNSDHAASDQLT